MRENMKCKVTTCHESSEASFVTAASTLCQNLSTVANLRTVLTLGNYKINAVWYILSCMLYCPHPQEDYMLEFLEWDIHEFHSS